MPQRPADQEPPTVHTDALNVVRDMAFAPLNVVNGDMSIGASGRHVIIPTNPKQIWAQVILLGPSYSTSDSCYGADPGCPEGAKLLYAFDQQDPHCGGTFRQTQFGTQGDGTVNPLYAPNDELVPDLSYCKIEEGAGWYRGCDEFVQEWIILTVASGSGGFQRPTCVITYSQQVCCNQAKGMSARVWYKIYKTNGTPIYVDNDHMLANTIALAQGYPVVPGSNPPSAYFCGECPAPDLPPS